MPKLLKELRYCRSGELVFGVPDDESDTEIHPLVGRLDKTMPILHGGVVAGTEVTVLRLHETLGDYGRRRVVILVDGKEVITGEWLVEECQCRGKEVEEIVSYPETYQCQHCSGLKGDPGRSMNVTFG